MFGIVGDRDVPLIGASVTGPRQSKHNTPTIWLLSSMGAPSVHALKTVYQAAGWESFLLTNQQQHYLTS